MATVRATAPEPLQVRVLGELEVLLPGGPVAVGGAVPRALVQRLVLAEGAVVTDAALAEDLWDGDPPPSATGSLQAHVSRLRRVLEPGRAPRDEPRVLVRRGPGYALRLAPGAVDAVRFEELAARGRALLEVDPAGAAAALDQALGLWRGPAYADVAARPFAAAAARRLEQLRTAAREDRAAVDLALGEPARAAAAAQLLTAEEPLRERGWELLALALYRQGRQADALAALRRLREVLAEELGTDPGPAAAALHRAVLAHDPALLGPAGAAPRRPPSAAVRATSNVPTPVSTTVGRRREVAEVGAMLAEHRLVTLVGPGGVGKTRLSLEVARGLRAPDGPWFVELADVPEGRLLPEAVTTALGVVPVGGTGALAAVLRGRETLLVLDDCEHLLDEVAPFVSELLGACPDLRVLASSREPLLVDGEHTYAVPALSGGAGGESVGLFLDRARALSPGWEPDAAELERVARVCAALDDLPLAVELAAGQLRALPLAEIEAMLDDRFALLRGSRRSGPRHATMQAAVEWSHDRLDAAEQEVFRDLAVFRGGFTLQAARRVLERPDVAPVLADLVTRSLVSVSGPVPGPGGARRYHLLETLRLFALSRTPPARRRELAARHAEWVADVAANVEPALRGRLAALETERLREESANIRAALHESDPATVVRVAGGFFWFWYREGLVAEGLGHLLPALAAVDGGRGGAVDEAALARAWTGVALLSYLAGDLPAVLGALRRTGEHAARCDSPLVRAQSLATVAYFEAFSGQVGPAREHAGAALAVCREVGHGPTLAETLMVLGEVERRDGDHAAALRRLEGAVAAADATGYSWVGVSARWIQAKAELDRGDLPAAWAAGADSLQRSFDVGETTSWLVALATLSHVLHRAGRPVEAAELAGVVAWRGGRIGFSPAVMDPDLREHAAALAAALTP
ncbi:AfsR/SARP family transcriptional regulator, partial [Kineococcus indalonis]|uniref:AfsR/SARP family transcriptional regulator n=1 Tax=Kineococcus indalonis TaxID=2696566 RepID=UPI001413441E